jgi:hypothetical protein
MGNISKLGKLGIVFFAVILSLTGCIKKLDKPQLAFDVDFIDFANPPESNINIVGDTIYFTFNYYVANYNNGGKVEPLEIISIKPSCTCTGYEIDYESEKSGKIILKTLTKNLNHFEYIDAIVKTNAENRFTLLKVKF